VNLPTILSNITVNSFNSSAVSNTVLIEASCSSIVAENNTSL